METRQIITVLIWYAKDPCKTHKEIFATQVLIREGFPRDSLPRRKSPKRPQRSKELKMTTQTTSESTVDVNKQLDRGFEFCGDIETVLFHLVLLTNSRRRFTISGTIMKLRESSSTVSGVNGKYDESQKNGNSFFSLSLTSMAFPSNRCHKFPWRYFCPQSHLRKTTPFPSILRAQRNK